jgi:hypothetical protein
MLLGPDVMFCLHHALFVSHIITFCNKAAGTYMIRSFGSPITVLNSDFCGNQVVGFGLIQLFMYEDDVEAAGNGGTLSDNVTCPFYAVSETIPEEGWQVSCIPFDADSCLDYTPLPTTSPSLSPTASLTIAPTIGSFDKKPHPKGMNMHMKPPTKGKGLSKASKSYASKSKASKGKSAKSSRRN